MRFISPYPGFRIVVKHQDIEILASGQPRVLKDGFTAEFRITDVTDWERDFARKNFAFRGTVTDEGGRDIDPTNSRVSSFDTSTINNDSLRKEVEQILLSHVDQGRDFYHVEAPKVAPPWPTYDKVPAAKIAAKVAEDGYDVEAVLAYERANKNRDSVLDALGALGKTEEEELVAA